MKLAKHNQQPIKAQVIDISPKTTQNRFKTNQHKVASALMIPQEFRERLSLISQKFGLPIDLGNTGVKDCTPDMIKAVRNLADLYENNSKLLPELMKQVSRLINADIKDAEFQANLTRAAIKHKEKLDKETANIFLAYAKHVAKSAKLEHRINTRAALIEKRTELYGQHYSESVFGSESAIIDNEYEIAASNQKILQESKTKRAEFNQERKQRAQTYIDAAYQ